MKEFLEFVAKLAPELYVAHQYVSRVTDAGPDPEIEKQLAMAFMRRISDERTRAEIERAQTDPPTDPG